MRKIVRNRYLLLLLLLFCFNFTYTKDQNENNDISYGSQTKTLHSISINAEIAEPININGNNELKDTAISGNGTVYFPYLISGLRIEDYSVIILIQIKNTDKFFRIENCVLLGRNTGMSFNNVTNGHIHNNTILNVQEGIYFYRNNKNNTVTNNTVQNSHSAIDIDYMNNNEHIIKHNRIINCSEGITIANSSHNVISGNSIIYSTYALRLRVENYSNYNNNNTIVGNNISYNAGHGMEIVNSINTTISGNIITNNSWAGIDFWSTSNSTILNNFISGNGYGVMFEQSSPYNIIDNNTITENTGAGIQLNDQAPNTSIVNNLVAHNYWWGVATHSNNTVFINNTISYHPYEGINLLSSNNYLSNNLISYQEGHGILIGDITRKEIVQQNNILIRNKFLDNNPDGTSQAYDTGSNNFSHNFWDDWTAPDDNADGIVDNPYRIDGPLNNYDYFPLVHPYAYYTYNEVFGQNIIFTILENETFFFYNCSLPEGYKITFQGKGVVRIENSFFYHTVFTQELDIIVINSTFVYSEISGNSTTFFYRTTLQQFFAYDNVTGMVLDCNIIQLFDGSPIPGAGHSGTMQKVSGYSRLIFSPMGGSGYWGAPPAGLIWMMEKMSHNETDFFLIMEGIVDLEFYIEGFNRNPDFTSKNISLRFYVDDILDGSVEVYSHPEDWGWRVDYQFHTNDYSDGLHVLKLVVNDSSVNNWIILPVYIHNGIPPSSNTTPSSTSTLSSEIPTLVTITPSWTISILLITLVILLPIHKKRKLR